MPCREKSKEEVKKETVAAGGKSKVGRGRWKGDRDEISTTLNYARHAYKGRIKERSRNACDIKTNGCSLQCGRRAIGKLS